MGVLEYHLDLKMKWPQIEDLHLQTNSSESYQLCVTLLLMDPDIFLQPCSALVLPLLPPSM